MVNINDMFYLCYWKAIWRLDVHVTYIGVKKEIEINFFCFSYWKYVILLNEAVRYLYLMKRFTLLMCVRVCMHTHIYSGLKIVTIESTSVC